MKRLLLALVFLGIVGMAQAKPLEVSVTLHSVKMTESKEQYGDQLYFVATEYKGGEEVRQYTVPKARAFWPAEILPKVKNVKIWGDRLEEGESVTLVLKLMERDIAPYDVDEPIGATAIKLHHLKGNIAVEWVSFKGLSLIPIGKTNGKLNHPQKVIFKGPGGVYEVDLAINLKGHTVQKAKSDHSTPLNTAAK